MSYAFLFLCALLTLWPQSSLAQKTSPAPKNPPKLALPLDCELGRDCWTVNYVDVDPGTQEADFTCGRKTYEGHQGTDFAVRSRLEMKKGVNVLAAAAGKVERVRDSEDDEPKSDETYQEIHDANRDCGNGVLIDHGQGFKTLYCHMKKGSIIVKAGDSVKEGDAIGQTGQSGYAEFPHLHFSVINAEGYLDPFTGMGSKDGCGRMKESLWKSPVAYEHFALFDAGFTSAAPDFKALAAGQEPVAAMPPSTPGLVFWVAMYHAREGDEITLTITGPDGAVFKERSIVVKTSRKRPSYFFTGRTLEGDRPVTGTYTGNATVRRAGTQQGMIQKSVRIE